ncbi:Homeobox-leucine zipper protein HAT4 [Linum perenne]
MADKQDLGLSLSLTTSTTTFHDALQLNLMPPQFQKQTPSSWIDTNLILNPSSDPVSEPTRSFLRGIDVNRTPATAAGDCDDDAGVSSPNSTISSVSGKRSEREEPLGSDPGSSGRAGVSDEEDGDTSRKKLRLSKDQSAVLEDSFKEHHTLNPKQKSALAKQLGLRPRQVEVWFQNRRARSAFLSSGRTKLKQTEVDCEFLKRCCENLTEENRRLQKEVQELRALKLSPQFYMQMTPPTTLTMCPSCERVGVPPSTSAQPHLMGPAHQHRPTPHVNPWAQTGAHGALNLLRPRS